MLFKDPAAAMKIFIHKLETLDKENNMLRIQNGELMNLLDKNGIDYREIKQIDYGFPSDGVIG